MQKFVIFSVIFFLAFPQLSFAVGGGGGGGGVSTACENDTWDCDSWSQCSLEGTQERTCELTFDCATDTSSDPVTTQSCTPECTEDSWSCSGWSPCFSNGTQTRTCTKTDDCPLIETSSPMTSQTCEPNCTSDTWACGAWSTCSAAGIQTRSCDLTFDCEFDDEPSPNESQICSPSCTKDTWQCADWSACDASGNQSRSCTLTNDCAGVVTEKPSSSQRCSYLQCEQKTLLERVTCRLELEPSGRARELEIRYYPEVCRPFEGHTQEECIEYYADYEPCWDLEKAQERVECAKKVLWLTDDIPTKKAACGTNEECLEELQEHVHHLILFRFYDLEQRAEKFIDEGVDVERTAAFVSIVIENKIAFLKATTHDERRTLIEKMRSDWNEHIKYVRAILNR